jgi:hypothetical protein
MSRSERLSQIVRVSARFSLAELLAAYVQEIISRSYSPQNLMRSLLRSYRDWDRLIRSLAASGLPYTLCSGCGARLSGPGDSENGND